MNKVRNWIASKGMYYGTPATILELYAEPTEDWIESIPLMMNHTHVVVDGDDPYKWNLDYLFETLDTQTALCYIQVITNGDNVPLGSVKPDWLSVQVTSRGLMVHDCKVYRQANELIVYVDEFMSLERVFEVVEDIRDFALYVSFTASRQEHRAKTKKMAVDFDRYHSSLGTSRYIPMREVNLGP